MVSFITLSKTEIHSLWNIDSVASCYPQEKQSMRLRKLKMEENSGLKEFFISLEFHKKKVSL